MSNNSIIDRITQAGIIPVVTMENDGDAVPLAGALAEGGLPIMEITFRTSAALKAIGHLASLETDILTGAGTVLTVDQVVSAIDAGARFVVSPGLNIRVVEYCLERNIPVFPGVFTPTEISSARDMGINVVKFFPAAAGGGVDYLKAISAPFSDVSFIPTGGIDENNLLSYLRLPFVRAVGGSWMVKKELLAQKQFAEIKRRTVQSVALVKGLERLHVDKPANNVG